MYIRLQVLFRFANTLLIQLILDQVDRYQCGDTFLLHGDTIETVCRIHRTTSVGDHDKLRIFCEFMQISVQNGLTLESSSAASISSNKTEWRRFQVLDGKQQCNRCQCLFATG